MLKNFRFWLWVTVVVQFLTAGIHSISLFLSPEPANETERSLFELMRTHHFEMGGGFSPTMENLVTALSSCLTLLCVFAALVNGYLLKKRAGSDLLGGILWINLVVFGVFFAITAIFTFPPPIVMSALIFVFTALALMFHRLDPERVK